MLRLRWLELGVVVLAALLAWVFHLTLPLRLPSEEDHRAAGAWLSGSAAEGDVVLLHPWWTERARLFAPSRVPVVGFVGSDSADLREHRRIWVLSQSRLPWTDDSAFEEAFLPGRTPLGPAQSFGPLRLQLYENGRYRPALWKATESLAGAQVYIEEPNGTRRPCRGNGQRFQCPGGGHLYVATEWHEVLYEPRRCLNLHAPGGEGRMVVEFAASPTARYELSAGIVWEHAWRHEAYRTPTLVEAASGAGRLAVELPVGFEGLKRAEGELPGGAVRIAVSSRVPETRQACVELTAWEPRP